MKIARNVAILLLLAAAVAFLPGGGRAAATLRDDPRCGVRASGSAFAGLWFYRQHRVDIYSLGDRRRGLLYGALGVGVVTLAAKARMWETGFGELVWFVLLGAGRVHAVRALPLLAQLLTATLADRSRETLA